MDECVAMRARHPLVHLSDDGLCAARGIEGAVDGGSQAHESVRIRWRNLHQHNVQRESAGFKQAFNLAEEDGRIVGAACGDRIAHIGAEKQSSVAKVPFELRLCVVCGAQRHHVNDLDVAHLGSSRHQRVYKN